MVLAVAKVSAPANALSDNKIDLSTPDEIASLKIFLLA